MQVEDYDIGVIVARLQVPTLHAAHISLIQEVIDRHKKCIIFIGTTLVLGSKENPLDYSCRASMVNSSFGDKVVVAHLPDFRSDKAWSDNLDEQIKSIYPNGKVCLYGGRDSFVAYYKGKFDSKEFPTHDYRPGTEVRADIGKEMINSEDFRKGVIYSTQNRYPIMYHTVDVAVLREEEVTSIGDVHAGSKHSILLGTKYKETELRLIGGFTDQFETLETACRREAEEESGAHIAGNLHYVGSYKIDDWRYKSCSDKIISSFFYGYYTFGVIEAKDDLEEVAWYDLEEIYEEVDTRVVDSHRQMIKDLYKKLNGGSE